jgi:hypothetical protein
VGALTEFLGAAAIEPRPNGLARVAIQAEQIAIVATEFATERGGTSRERNGLRTTGHSNTAHRSGGSRIARDGARRYQTNFECGAWAGV